MQDMNEKASLDQKLAGVIKKQRRTIIIAVAVIVALIIFGIVYNKVSTNKYEKTMNKLFAVETKLQGIDVKAEENTKELDSIINDLDAISSASKVYPKAKANLSLANIYYQKGDYNKTIEYLDKAVEVSNRTYLTQIALINRAVVYEDNNQVDKALEDYQKIWDDFGKESAYSPKALFAIARIYDEKNNIELAKSTYEQLVDQFPNSEYSRLAENRLSLL